MVFSYCCVCFQILYQVLLNLQQHEQAAQGFYVTYFTDILQHIFSVVTDTSHTAGKIYALPPLQVSLLDLIVACFSLQD